MPLDRKCEELVGSFKRAAKLREANPTARSMKRHSVNAVASVQLLQDFRSALEINRASGHRWREWSQSEVTYVAEFFEKRAIFTWTPGRRLPESSKSQPDQAEHLSLQAAAGYLATFLKSDKLRAVVAEEESPFCDDAIMGDHEEAKSS